MTTNRKDIPLSVRNEVLLEACYMCGNPRCRQIIPINLHHIVQVAESGGNDASNLLVLCPNCHALYHNGNIPMTAIRHWKGMLVALNHAIGREDMDILLYLHTAPNNMLWYSADGLLRFARLIAAGLVNRGQGSCGGGLTGVWTSSFSVDLSQKGRLLVEAWLAGDEDAYVDMLDKSIGS